ncbi:MAG: hypothetical protein JXA18_15195 [Chitinispirillaceae bacterium]|nr:hypothetical protein [Chitinispirillaceae bacterium]
MNRKILLFVYSALFCFQMLFAAESSIKIIPSGFAYYQIGQLVKTSDPEGLITGLPDKSWDQHVNFRLALEGVVGERLRIIAGTELGIATFAKGAGGGNNVTTAISLKEAQGIYTFGNNVKNPPLQIALGYFPFKYNPQATNMGEYLFSYRTGAYAPYIINDFDNCKSRLLGLRVSSTLFESFKNHLLFTSEMAVGSGKGNWPVGDYSLSYLAGYTVKNILDIGAGICLNRLVPIDPLQTTPSGYNAIIAKDERDSVIMENGDTLYLTMKATKLMARLSFDPKQFLPPGLLTIFGKEDGKLYTETAILGLKNYGAKYHYDDITKRWPVMWGINVPAFKLLDFLSLEMEYYGWKDNLTIAQGTPMSNTTQDEYSDEQTFRWSLFAQKTVIKGFCVKALAGKDHFRTVDAGGSVTNEELLRGHDNWHYNLRLMFQF